MVITVSLWGVRVELEGGRVTEIGIYDDHVQSVLRKLSGMEFGGNVVAIHVTAPVATDNTVATTERRR